MKPTPFPFLFQARPSLFVSAALMALGVCGAQAQPIASGLPLRNLAVEFRQVDATEQSSQGVGVGGTVTSSSGGGTTVDGSVRLSSRQASNNLLVASQVRVVNGGRASIRIVQTLPVQWVQAVDAGGRRGPSVVHGVTWLEAGRALVVRPRWPGGEQAVTVELQADSASVDDRSGQPLPSQAASQTATTVLAPMGEWVTIATTSGSHQQDQRGTLSSASASGTQTQWLQLKVSLP